MHPIPLLRARALRPLLEFAKRADVEVPSSLARVESVFRDPRALIPLALVGRLWEDVARANEDEAIGLRVGEQSRIEEIGELGWLMRRASSVGEALETGVRLGPRVSSGYRFSVGRRGDEAWLRGSFVPAVQRGRQQANDCTLMLILHAIRLGAGPEWRPSELHLEGPAPRHADQLAALAEDGVRFGEPSMTLVFPRRVLALPLPPAPLPLLSSRATPRGAIPAPDFRRSIRQLVAALLRLGSANLGFAAEMSGMSVRSLQRRLHESQLEFGHLVDEARLELARRMLGDSELKIVEVAAELGYTDSANFTRAFRRWTGVPPRDFRRVQAVP